MYASGLQAQLTYDLFGRVETLVQNVLPDFEFAGYFLHARSGLNLMLARAYSAELGRFINRDPISERGGLNLFAYVHNAPVQLRDPMGFAPPGNGKRCGNKPWGSDPSLGWGYTGDGDSDDSDDDPDDSHLVIDCSATSGATSGGASSVLAPPAPAPTAPPTTTPPVTGPGPITTGIGSGGTLVGLIPIGVMILIVLRQQSLNKCFNKAEEEFRDCITRYPSCVQYCLKRLRQQLRDCYTSHGIQPPADMNEWFDTHG